jgi:predicted  nucleic acid-binding Zn-ribbon protein
LNSSSNVGSQNELSRKERELRDYDERINDLNDELARLSKQGEVRTKLSLKRSEKESKEKDVQKL